MTLSASQVRYLPNLNYIQRIAISDVFVVMDEVQFDKRDYEHRNLFLNGTTDKMLSLQVGKVKRGTPVRDITFNSNAMLSEHKQFIIDEYGSYPHYSSELVEKLFKAPQNENFFVFGYYTLKTLLDYLDIDTKVVLQSGVKKYCDYNKGISDMMYKHKADLYLSGAGGRNYLLDASYDIKYHTSLLDYKYSILHYIFLLGKDAVKIILEEYSLLED